MPYVYVEELSEGQEEAEVYDADSYREALSAKEKAEGDLAAMTVDRDKLASELESAKTRFADAFLSSPAKMKADQADDIKQDGEPKTFATLFSERNKYNAN